MAVNKIGIGFFVAGVTLLALGTCDYAKAAPYHERGATLRIIEDVPTVLGIRREPRPGRFYDARQPRVTERPSADVLRLDAPAPPSNCPGAFEVVSGPRSERGCYGGR